MSQELTELARRLDRVVFLLLERAVVEKSTRGSYSFGSTRRLTEIDQELTRLWREVKGQEVLPLE